jgi:hypothetical protein
MRLTVVHYVSGKLWNLVAVDEWVASEPWTVVQLYSTKNKFRSVCRLAYISCLTIGCILATIHWYIQLKAFAPLFLFEEYNGPWMPKGKEKKRTVPYIADCCSTKLRPGWHACCSKAVRLSFLSNEHIGIELMFITAKIYSLRHSLDVNFLLILQHQICNLFVWFNMKKRQIFQWGLGP